MITQIRENFLLPAFLPVPLLLLIYYCAGCPATRLVPHSTCSQPAARQLSVVYACENGASACSILQTPAHTHRLCMDFFSRAHRVTLFLRMPQIKCNKSKVQNNRMSSVRTDESKSKRRRRRVTPPSKIRKSEKIPGAKSHRTEPLYTVMSMDGVL